MKCFTIKDNECVAGIDASRIPITENILKEYSDGVVLDAIVITNTTDRDDIAFEQLFKTTIHRASAICSIVFDKNKDKKDGSDRILIAYDPTEMLLSAEGGDMSDIVFRSSHTFVALCKKNSTVIRKIIRKKQEEFYQIEYTGDCPVKRDIPTQTHNLPDDSIPNTVIVEIK